MADRAILVLLGVILFSALALPILYSPIPGNRVVSVEEPEIVEEPAPAQIPERPKVQEPEVVEPQPEQPVAQEPPAIKQPPLLKEPHVIINGRIVTVEIVDTPEARSRGLMFRDPLPENHGMLFVFEGQGIYSFWAMNMKFNLDIIWINNDARVVHIEKNVPPCSRNCPSYTPKAQAIFVLEVNSGLVDEIGLEEGSLVEIRLSN